MEITGSSEKRVENTVGKGEIARYEQVLLFPQCFQKTCAADLRKKKQGFFGRGLNQTTNFEMSLIERQRFQTVVKMEESLLIQHNNNNKTHIEGKEKNTCYGHVLIFP